MAGMSTRLADTWVLSAGADPQIGLSASEVLLPMPTPLNNAVVDTGLSEMPASRAKTLAVVVTTTLTWVTSGQATVQLFAARSKYGVLGSDTATATVGPSGWQTPTTPFLGSVGAASGFPTGNVPNTSQLIGNTANLGAAAATSLAAGIYWFDPSAPSPAIPDLQWWYPVLGVEAKFPSALTAGSFFVAFEVAPN
jgi:hypothetical protein